MVQVSEVKEVVPEYTKIHYEIRLDWYDEFSDLVTFVESSRKSEQYFHLGVMLPGVSIPCDSLRDESRFRCRHQEHMVELVNRVHALQLTEEQFEDLGGINGEDLHDLLKRIEWLIISSGIRRPENPLPLVKIEGGTMISHDLSEFICAIRDWDGMGDGLRMVIAKACDKKGQDFSFVFQSRRPWRIRRSDDMRTYFCDVRFGFGFVPMPAVVSAKQAEYEQFAADNSEGWGSP